jgi:GT2 family glycosyltransferase
MMPGRKLRRRTESHRRLVHLLNQRYHQEFLRAERLAADLALVEALRATWLFRLLKRVKDWLRPPPRIAPGQEAVPLELSPVVPRGRVSLVIPFRDRPELLRECLGSLALGTYRNYEVVLVDNDSTDPRLLRALARLGQRRRVRAVSCPGAFNFSHVCNEGARAATGDWLVFLNNDTVVLTPDWLEQMLVVAGQPQVGVVGATLLYPDGTLQHAGMARRTDGVWEHCYRARPGDDPGDRGELRRVRAVPAVSAACLLIGKELFWEVGGFDEARAVTHNDTDLCRRVRDGGRLVAVTPHARLLHYESLSRGYTLTPRHNQDDRDRRAGQ